jgi:predicted membrane protein
MENQDINKQEQEQMWRNWEKDHKRGKVFGGLLIVVIGTLFLARELGAELPQWLFSWKTLLIGIGLVMGFKHRFRNFRWLIPVTIGAVFLGLELSAIPISKQLLWPVLAIIIGLFIMFKPRRKYKYRQWKRWQHHHGHHYNYDKYGKYDWCSTENTSDDYLNSTVIFGSIEKSIISKDFKGGEIEVVFGGAEINLSQADIAEKATLEVTQVFGGTTLVIPSNWEIKSELTSILGSIEDKRAVQPNATSSNKILMLKGTIVCGGIDIKSF